MSTPTIIGLTGGIGSGKTTIADLFHDLGVPYVDADHVAREVVQPGEPCLDAIVNRYGEQILTPDGTLDRAQLRHLIFSTPTEKEWLEQLTHPVIKARLISQLNNQIGPYVLLVHPLLFEKGQDNLCQYTIAVSVPQALQIARVTARDRNSVAQVERILATQLSNEERCNKANFILKNTSNHEELSGRVLKLHNKILKLLA